MKCLVQRLGVPQGDEFAGQVGWYRGLVLSRALDELDDFEVVPNFNGPFLVKFVAAHASVELHHRGQRLQCVSLRSYTYIEVDSHTSTVLPLGRSFSWRLSWDVKNDSATLLVGDESRGPKP